VRTDWVPLSASALVIGAMALVLGALLNPLDPSSSVADSLHVVQESGGRWMGMAVMYFLSSVCLMLGLPAVLSLFTKRGRGVGCTAAAVLSIGFVGLAGYAMLMVFFRALVNYGQLRGRGLDDVIQDNGLAIFLYGWVGCFMAGVLLLGLALWLSRKTSRWVPVLFGLYLLLTPLAGQLGRFGTVVQTLLLGIAFTAVAIATVSDEQRRELARDPAF
jgi:hypothetical protein